MNYRLGDALQRHLAAPRTFHIPTVSTIEALGPGDTVKLLFQDSDGGCEERMWVIVTKRDGDEWEGTLDNDPIDLLLEHGQIIHFQTRHIASVLPSEWGKPGERVDDE